MIPRLCDYHTESLGWDTCTEGQEDQCEHGTARLYAAAPDMLAALKETVNSLEYAVQVLEAPALSTIREGIRNAKAVIARAEPNKGVVT